MNDLARDQHGLTARQKAFADAWAEAKIRGAKFADWRIAEAAGYIGDEKVLGITAVRTLANPKVRDYLHQRAKDYLREGAVEVAVTLRTLGVGAQSERVRADTAARLAAGLGLIDGDVGQRGPAVAVQVVFQHGGGARLAQLAGQAVEPQAIRHVEQVEHSLVEGEGGRKAGRARRPATPPPGRAHAAEAPPGVKNRAAPPAAVRPVARAPRKLPGENSGGSGV